MIRATFTHRSRILSPRIRVPESMVLCLVAILAVLEAISVARAQHTVNADSPMLATTARGTLTLQGDAPLAAPRPFDQPSEQTKDISSIIFRPAAQYNRLWTRNIDIAHEPPVLSGGTLFIVSREGILYALNSQTGVGLWIIDLKTYLRPPSGKQAAERSLEPLRAKVKVSGIQPAPTVSGRYIFVSVSDRQDGHVLAVDRISGTVLWHHASLGGASSPTRGKVTASPSADGQRVVVRTGAGLTALRVDSGKELWNVPIDSSEGAITLFASQPVLTEDLVYIGADSGVAYAFETSNGHKRWQFTTDAFQQQQKGVFSEVTVTPTNCRPLLVGDTLMVATGTGNVYGLDAQKGAPRWRRQMGQAWQMTQTDRCVYACTATGLFELDGKTGALFRSLPLEGGAFSCVVSPSHILIVRNATKYSGWEFLDLATWQTVPCPVKFLADLGVAADSGGVIAAGRTPDAPWRGPRLLSAYSAKASVTAKPPITAQPPAKRRSR